MIGGLLVAVAWSAAALLGAAPAGAQADRSPTGRLDPPRVLAAGSVQISGYAVDPDSRGPISVIVSAGGRLAGGRAGLVRRDLPAGSNRRGFSFTISGLRPGPTQVCAGAFNVGPGVGRLIGCALVNTGGPNPIAAIDTVVATGADTAQLSGWALDPDTPFPTPVEITVDGVVATRVVASGPRPDVEAAYPGWTPWHGLTADLRVPEGTHRICVRPQNLGAGRTVDAACRSYTTPDVNPFGSLDAVSVVDGSVVVAGWAAERDRSDPPPIVVSIDGPGPDDPDLVPLVPSLDRPDVRLAAGLAGNLGFRASWAAREPGVHLVCVAAANRGWGGDRLLGCRSVTVLDGRPSGDLESVVADGSSVQVSGWAADPADLTPVQVRVTTDRGPASVIVTANGDRPDLAGIRPPGGTGVGFSARLLGLGAGAHRICVEASDRTGPSDALAGPTRWCGSALVGSTRLGLVDAASAETAVGPPATSAVADVDRDAGVSARLRDGSVLWLFGDSIARRADGTLRYFVSGTAAWASADHPEVTRDAVEGGAPVRAATPGPGFPACPPERPVAAMWPMSAVTIADGPRDRVVAWFADMCLGPQPSFEAVGTSVGEWEYDPADPPVDRAVTFTISNQRLWDDVGPGEAAVAAGGGTIVVYHCAGPEGGGWYDRYGPCTAAQIDSDEVADPAAYRFWDGSGWGATRSGAAALSLPASGTDGVGTFPPSAFGVTWDDAVGRFVMTYTSWPGFTPTTWVRVAPAPNGPWSEALRLDVSGCDATIGGAARSCYAATAQPVASGPGLLGLGVYRSWLADDPRRGGYRLLRIRRSGP